MADYACPAWMQESQPGARWNVEQEKIERVYKRLSQLHSREAILGLAIGGQIHLTIARYIYARGGDEDKAWKALSKTLRWRSEKFGETLGRSNLTVDDILRFSIKDEKMKAIRRCHPHGWQGYDKEGRLVYMVRAGLINTNSLKYEIDEDDAVLCHVQAMEFQNKVLLKPEGSPPDVRRLNGVTVICDMSGLNIHHVWPLVYKLLRKISELDQENYPENLAKMIIINAPFVFYLMWRILVPHLDIRTRGKVSVFSSSQDHMPALVEIMDISKIPRCIGGTSLKDATYWEGGYALSQQHSSHISMDEFIDHHIRLNGRMRPGVSDNLRGLATVYEAGAYDASDGSFGGMQPRRRFTPSNASASISPSFFASESEASFGSPAMGRTPSDVLLAESHSEEHVDTWAQLTLNALFPIVILLLPCPFVVYALHHSVTLRRAWEESTSVAFTVGLGATASCTVFLLVRQMFAALAALCARHNLQVPLLRHKGLRYLLYFLSMLPTWQCIAIIVLVAQQLCNRSKNTAVWLCHFSAGMFGDTSVVHVLFSSFASLDSASNSGAFNVETAARPLNCEQLGDDYASLSKGSSCWKLASLLGVFLYSTLLATSFAICHTFFGSKGNMCLWLMKQLQACGLATERLDSNITRGAGGVAMAGSQDDAAAATPAFATFVNDDDDDDAGIGNGQRSPIFPASPNVAEIQGRVWTMRRKKKIDPNRTMVRKEVWLVIDEDRFEIYKDSYRRVRHYCMDLRCVQAQELTAVLYGFTVSDGQTTVVLEAGSTVELHTWLRNIKMAVSRAASVDGILLSSDLNIGDRDRARSWDRSASNGSGSMAVAAAAASSPLVG